MTASQALIDHARLTTGQTVLAHGAAGGVGSIAVKLAREVGPVVIGTGRALERDTALGLGVHSFLDLETDKLEDAGEVDVVFESSAARSSTARLHWTAPAARSSPSRACPPSGRRTAAPSSSSWQPTAPASQTSPRGLEADGSSRS